MKISNGVNKKISFPIAIIIIVILAVLVGGLAVWQYLKIPAEIGCNLDSDCLGIDCSKYNKRGLMEGFRPFCVDNKCECKCYGCE